MRLAWLACALGALALSACSLDWDYPTEDPGAGGATEGGGGGSTEAAGGAGGTSGVGGDGGDGGTTGGPSIEILSPEDGATHSHSEMVLLHCMVRNYDAGNNQVEWRSSVEPEVTLGTGCDFMTFLPVGNQDLIVRLFGASDQELASDTVQVTVTP